jgi:Protein of unknown function (DUF4238)
VKVQVRKLPGCQDSWVSTPAMPPPLTAFAALLGVDAGQALGHAVLLASVVGFNVVENRKADLAATSGVSAARIQQIVDTGRQALNTASPRIPGQHVVSQALLKRFCIPTSQSDQLISYNLQFGTSRRRSPRAVGKLENFVKIDSQETEQLWGLTEQNLPAAIDAARTRQIFNQPQHVATIKAAIALHFARGLEVLDTTDALWQRWLAEARAAFLFDRRRMEELYYLKHGIVASGAAVAQQIADDLMAEPEALYRSGAAFRLRVVDFYEEARRWAASAHLEILRPAGRSEFLIGDTPAITIDGSRQTFGLRAGVTFGDATTVVLPLSPKRVAALGSADRSEAVPAAGVRLLNSFQVANARSFVYMRPGSGLEGFVASQRPPTGPAAA